MPAYLPQKVDKPRRLVRDAQAIVEFEYGYKPVQLTIVSHENESVNDAFKRAAIRIGAKLVYVTSSATVASFE